MNGSLNLPEDIQKLVLEVGEAITTEGDLERYARAKEIADRSYKLHTVVDAWQQQQRDERNLRRTYAGWVLFALSVEMVFVAVIFVLLGTAKLKVSDGLAKTFVISVFAEIASMAVVVIKYLFPRTESELLRIVERL